MHANNTTAWTKEPSVEEREKQQDFERVLGMSAHRRQASQAGKLWRVFSQSPARFYMSFSQFMKPSQRNRILTEYGLEEMVDPLLGKKRKLKPVTKH